MKKRHYLLILILLISCRKPYNPPVINSSGSFLVVEGVINAAGVTVIKLSRTVNISTGSVANPVTGATITIESNQNSIDPLAETKPGTYQSNSLTLNNPAQYHLRIKTSDGQEYLSDYAIVESTPPIDSIGFTVQGAGIQVYVNTHDPSNNTHYYRWDYDETWRFHAKYQSNYITNGTAIVPRTPAQLTYTCFANDTSSTLVLGSSAKLSKDLIYENPIIQIASTSEKIESRYSIQVRQYALTGDAYNFWVNLKKNTEELGSIFDPEPSNIKGNIHNTANAAEPVIGYISVCSVQSKRVYIDEAQLPQTWTTTYPYDCQLDSEWFCHPKTSPCQNDVENYLVPLQSGLVPVYPYYLNASVAPVGYQAANVDCTDCTLRGTTTIPSFWKP